MRRRNNARSWSSKRSRSKATKQARFAIRGIRNRVGLGVNSAMRFSIAAALLFALAACGDAGPSAQRPPAPEDHAALVAGDYKPSSNTARAITGAMVVQTGGISFENGVILYTRTLNPRRGGDLVAKNGDSYAAAVLGPGTLSVELRRVTEQVLPEGVIGLCGAERPQYVALAYDERATTVTMLVFSGDEPPGPQAMTSRVCARFGYAAPEGARTREGVVL